MSQTNSQSTQAEECGVSKISAEVDELLDSLPLRTRCTIRAEFDRLAETAAKDAAKITVLKTKLDTIKDDSTELFVEFRTLEDTFDLPQTHAHHLIKEIIRETSLKRRR